MIIISIIMSIIIISVIIITVIQISMTNDETDSTMAPPWWRITSPSSRRHGDIDDGDDDTDDDA